MSHRIHLYSIPFILLLVLASCASIDTLMEKEAYTAVLASSAKLPQEEAKPYLEKLIPVFKERGDYTSLALCYKQLGMETEQKEATKKAALAVLLPLGQVAQWGSEKGLLTATIQDDVKCAAYVNRTDGKTIHIIDLTTGLETRTINGDSANITYLKFLPDSKTILSRDSKNTIRILDIESGKKAEEQTFKDSNLKKYHFEVSPNGEYFAFGGSSWKKSIAYLYRSSTGSKIATLDHGKNNTDNSTTHAVSIFAFSADDKYAALASPKEKLLYTYMADRREYSKKYLEDFADIIALAVYHTDPKGAIYAIDSTGKLATIPLGKRGRFDFDATSYQETGIKDARRMTTDASGKKLLVYTTNRVHTWDLVKGELMDTKRIYKNPLDYFVMSPAGDCFYGYSKEGFFKLENKDLMGTVLTLVDSAYSEGEKPLALFELFMKAGLEDDAFALVERDGKRALSVAHAEILHKVDCLKYEGDIRKEYSTANQHESLKALDVDLGDRYLEKGDPEKAEEFFKRAGVERTEALQAGYLERAENTNAGKEPEVALRRYRKAGLSEHDAVFKVASKLQSFGETTHAFFKASLDSATENLNNVQLMQAYMRSCQEHAVKGSNYLMKAADLFVAISEPKEAARASKYLVEMLIVLSNDSNRSRADINNLKTLLTRYMVIMNMGE